MHGPALWCAGSRVRAGPLRDSAAGSHPTWDQVTGHPVVTLAPEAPGELVELCPNRAGRVGELEGAAKAILLTI